MTGYGSMDISVANLWRCYCEYQKGKKKTYEFNEFKYNLERELFKLHKELTNCSYQPGQYRYFEVADNKKRTIAVAPLRDIIVHRLIYDYLVEIYDKIFIHDAWSCRKGKGLHKAIERTQSFLRKYQGICVWRCDIKKFFDSVSHEVLLEIIKLRIKDEFSLSLIDKVIKSYDLGNGRGIPIGNLTSQIFANIYLNEFDRYVKNELKPLAYLRYGDDFIVFVPSKTRGDKLRFLGISFLYKHLSLRINFKSDIIIKPKAGLHLLGCIFYQKNKVLSQRNRQRIAGKLNYNNFSSYYGVVNHFGQKQLARLNWEIIKVLEYSVI